jgi:hypothetical protein
LSEALLSRKAGVRRGAGWLFCQFRKVYGGLALLSFSGVFLPLKLHK